ncbi:hypothetical protein [Kutzneria buriramensis]|uniref:Uncharacterized protein n=1 Tax=Kutzneria buriramensis TaxID=1045776 RepID=A0A3E0HVF8_9PSEU|nr:hypothetical protein [Kutzneria buriramensis]REH49955.1 hypothetical protein BCF44_104221 [Kutzneria buriramensis]
MPLSSEVRQLCKALLPPGEQIEYVFPALSVGQPGMISLLVVVGTSGITLLACKFFQRHVPESVWATFPRSVRLSPEWTSAGRIIELGTMRLEIDEEYVPVARAADAEHADSDWLPPDPLPDL